MILQFSCEMCQKGVEWLGKLWCNILPPLGPPERNIYDVVYIYIEYLYINHPGGKETIYFFPPPLIVDTTAAELRVMRL